MDRDIGRNSIYKITQRAKYRHIGSKKLRKWKYKGKWQKNQLKVNPIKIFIDKNILKDCNNSPMSSQYNKNFIGKKQTSLQKIKQKNMR